MHACMYALFPSLFLLHSQSEPNRSVASLRIMHLGYDNSLTLQSLVSQDSKTTCRDLQPQRPNPTQSNQTSPLSYYP
ncbi:hypothetical protein F4810DRAFT_664920 [Camillea tinctor]|nr:hypothetical protein F4810DRAFT_664920 [Camillea tinctor]